MARNYFCNLAVLSLVGACLPICAQPALSQTAQPTSSMPNAQPAIASDLQLKTATPLSDFVGVAKAAAELTQAQPQARTAAYVTIPAQVGASFTTGPGAGYESSFVGMDGFIPIWQTPGKDLTYVQGRLLLATAGGYPGGNILLGYRRFNPAGGSILGGYVGYDVRNTGAATFGQLGAGVEGIWPGFEARLNGYLPVGNSRQTVDRQDFSSSSSTANLSGSRFQGNSLLFDFNRATTVTQVSSRRDQIALGGFDAEAGLKLLQWRSDGDLRSYLGLYYYSGTNVGGFVGVRGRLVARINQYASVGVSVQGDPEFGTTAAVTVGFTFPGVSRQTTSEPASNWARMGDRISRSDAIAVTDRTQTSRSSQTTYSTESQAALNPTTGQPYVFEHVVLGNTGGNGTFENPFGTVANALTATTSSGNDIVYVQPGTNPGIPAFTIPANVQVLSTGPVQTLATVQAGTVQLPLSGAGTLPSVTDTVTMGNNTVLSGFAITPPTGSPAILANGVQTVTIVKNQVKVSGTDTPGIRLRDVSGTASVSNNTISTAGATSVFPTGAFGIFADITNTTLSNLILTENTIANSGFAGHGISVTTRNTGVITDATVANNTIKTTAASGLGILVLSLNTSSIANATVANNTINTAAINAIGISINPRDTSSIKTAIVSGNTISTAGTNAYGIIANSRNSGSITSLITSGNTISTTGTNSFGILMLPVDTSLVTSMTASDNKISTTGTGAHGIYVIPQNTGAIANVAIANNTLATTGTGASGMYLNINQPAATSLQATISGNTITQSGSYGLWLDTFGSTQATATIANNTLSNNNGIGILVRALNNSQVRAITDNNQVTNVILNSALQLGITVESYNTAQLFASVTNNRVMNTNAYAGTNVVEYKTQMNSTLNACVRFLNNTASNSGYVMNRSNSGLLNLEPFTGNVGTRQTDIGTITNVAAGLCGF